MATSKKWFIIVNPTSGNGSTKKKWPKIKEELESQLFDFQYVLTEYSNHSVELAQQAISEGFKHIISVGGDGTLHNIVNGIMSQKIVATNTISIGVIPIGTGNDWVKTHNIPRDFYKAIQVIKNGNSKQQDIGKIELINANKKVHYFMNLAGVGFDGYVVSKVERYKAFGALAYLIGTLLGISSFKNFNSTILINKEEIKSKSLMVLVGICQYSGGGMQLTKNPNPFDGLLDISVAGNFSKFDVIKNASKLFNGKIVDFKKVDSYKTNAIEIKVNQKELPFIQADGELIGKGSFKASIIGEAFSFYC